MTDRSTDSLYRLGVPTLSTGPTYVRDVRTHADIYSPTSEYFSSVTHARTYGFGR